MLEGAPEALDEDVVDRAPFTVHAELDVFGHAVSTTFVLKAARCLRQVFFMVSFRNVLIATCPDPPYHLRGVCGHYFNTTIFLVSRRSPKWRL